MKKIIFLIFIFISACATFYTPPDIFSGTIITKSKQNISFTNATINPYYATGYYVIVGKDYTYEISCKNIQSTNIKKIK